MSLTHNVIENSQITVISRLFSASVIKELSRKGRSPLFARLVKQSPILESKSKKEPISNTFDSAFELLQKKIYRNEYIYKAALTHKILLGTHSLNTAVLLNEFRTGKNIADTVIVNGTSTVYEIKSERDSLTRLEEQITSYRNVFAKVNVIAGGNHIKQIKSLIPHDIGILKLNDRYQISTIREAVESTEQIKPRAIFESIQLNEAKKILMQMDIEVPKLPNTQMYQALRELFITLTPDEAHYGMVQILRTTRSQKSLKELVISLPYSIQSLVLLTSIRKQDYRRLLDTMKTPIEEALTWK